MEGESRDQAYHTYRVKVKGEVDKQETAELVETWVDASVMRA